MANKYQYMANIKIVHYFVFKNLKSKSDILNATNEFIISITAI